jgi:hypothetical protein
MGRSLAPIDSVAAREIPPGRFNALGSSFEVVRQGKQVVHRQARLDQAGEPIWSLDLPVDYVIGSGTRGHSFVFQRDGFLFQTPISWFTQKHVWDSSPGLSPSMLAGRPVVPECLFCHANHARPVADSRNGYERPIFDGHAIGCERCHGPGKRHVSERRNTVVVAGQLDPTIVNPAKLTPELRDAVCAQCHLTGEPRVLRRGRDLYDFRPGMPLHLFWSVFVQDRKPGMEDKAVNHFEQMHLSRCFQRSAGAKKLGCVSCHDAHEQPAEARRVEHYRRACLECHAQRGCTVTREVRLRASKDDSCILCHMPHYSASDIAHTAATDHRIVRKRPSPSPGREKGIATRLPVPFYRDSASNTEEDQARDLGIALARLASTSQDDPDSLARQAVDLLDQGVAAFPDDVPALEARGQALTILGRLPAALTSFEAALAKAPGREVSLHGAALLAQRMGDRHRALTYWRRAVEVDPQAADYRGNLAILLVETRAWDEARPHAQAWLRLAPDSREAREMHVRFLLRDGDRQGAEAEREKIRRMR